MVLTKLSLSSDENTPGLIFVILLLIMFNLVLLVLGLNQNDINLMVLSVNFPSHSVLGNQSPWTSLNSCLTPKVLLLFW